MNLSETLQSHVASCISTAADLSRAACGRRFVEQALTDRSPRRKETEWPHQVFVFAIGIVGGVVAKV